MTQPFPRPRRCAHLAWGAFAALALLAAGDPAHASGPPELPASADGLWSIDRAGRISSGSENIEMRKIWRACLDERAHRALETLDILQLRAAAAVGHARCDAPRYTLSGNVLSSTMHCAGAAPDRDGVGHIRVSRATTFLSPGQSRTVSDMRRDTSLETVEHYVTDMRRLGACEPGQRPGDMVLTNWKIDGEESLKGRRAGNVYRAIEARGRFIESRLSQPPAGDGSR